MAEQADPRSTEFLLQLRLKELLADIDKDSRGASAGNRTGRAR